MTKLLAQAEAASGEEVERASPQAPRRAQWRLDGASLAYAMVIPALAIVALLILLPLVYSVFLSLFDWRLLDMNRVKAWAGLDNYTHLFADGALARRAP